MDVLYLLNYKAEDCYFLPEEDPLRKQMNSLNAFRRKIKEEYNKKYLQKIRKQTRCQNRNIHSQARSVISQPIVDDETSMHMSRRQSFKRIRSEDYQEESDSVYAPFLRSNQAEFFENDSFLPDRPFLENPIVGSDEICQTTNLLSSPPMNITEGDALGDVATTHCRILESELSSRDVLTSNELGSLTPPDTENSHSFIYSKYDDGIYDNNTINTGLNTPRDETNDSNLLFLDFTI